MKRPFVLLGFMGSGKSAVGRLLAERLGRPFVDTDESVVAMLGASIPEIFATRGEAAFRRAELDALVVAGDGAPIVATGGGLPTRAAARLWIRRHALSCWLDVGIDELRRRVAAGEGRPLWPSDPVGQRVLYESRTPCYALADYRVDAAASPAAVVERICIEFPRNLA